MSNNKHIERVVFKIAELFESLTIVAIRLIYLAIFCGLIFAGVKIVDFQDETNKIDNQAIERSDVPEKIEHGTEHSQSEPTMLKLDSKLKTDTPN